MAALRVCARQLPRAFARTCLASPARRRNSNMVSYDEAGPSSRPDMDPWAHIFDSIDDVDSRIHAHQWATAGGRPHKMTRMEINAFDNMFDMIFTAIGEQQAWTGVRPLGAGLDGAAIGPSADLNEIVGKVQNRKKDKSKMVQPWTTEDQEKLDRFKEDMELCETDAALLKWARNNVFTDTVANGAPGGTYPVLLALLMRAFRERFEDPHLALSVFEHARHLSVPSFVFGCTTLVYNELLATRWNAFRDLKGVRDTLEEMKVNGVRCNDKTRVLVENIRREVGERNAWLEDSLTSGVVFSMLQELNLLSTPPAERLPPAKEEKEHKNPRRWKNTSWKNSQEWKYRFRDDGVETGQDSLDQMWSVNLFASPANRAAPTPRPQRSLL